MQAVTTIGLDIAKSVFQIHGVDAAGNVIVRRQLKRRYVLPFFQKLPPCLVGIEACASSHHWSRELQAIGHTVRLMPPAYVKPYVKRHKNDAADAEAICEAVTRANMRFVATKTPEQQSCLMLHRIRHLFIRHQTSVINAIRAHLAEFGIVAPVGRNGGCGQFRPASTSRRTMTHRYSIRSNSQQMPPEGGARDDGRRRKRGQLIRHLEDALALADVARRFAPIPFAWVDPLISARTVAPYHLGKISRKSPNTLQTDSRWASSVASRLLLSTAPRAASTDPAIGTDPPIDRTSAFARPATWELPRRNAMASKPTDASMPFLNLGKEQTEAMLSIQKELLDAYDQSSRAWLARVKSEVDLWSDLAKKLSTTQSVPDAVGVYQQCVAQRMQMAAEDGRRLYDDCQKITQTITRSLSNGRPAAST